MDSSRQALPTNGKLFSKFELFWVGCLRCLSGCLGSSASLSCING